MMSSTSSSKSPHTEIACVAAALNDGFLALPLTTLLPRRWRRLRPTRPR